jgi:hypothetical protein
MTLPILHFLTHTTTCLFNGAATSRLSSQEIACPFTQPRGPMLHTTGTDSTRGNHPNFFAAAAGSKGDDRMLRP